MYSFPEHYGGEAKGLLVTDDNLVDAADFADLVNSPEDYLSPEDRAKFSARVPEPQNLDFHETVAAYQYLKQVT